jgi:hypothetical protein
VAIFSCFTGFAGEDSATVAPAKKPTLSKNKVDNFHIVMALSPK